MIKIKNIVYTFKQEFICDWIQSQSADLKTMTDAACGDSKERSAEYYYQVYNEIDNIVQLNNSDYCYQVYYKIVKQYNSNK